MEIIGNESMTGAAETSLDTFLEKHAGSIAANELLQARTTLWKMGENCPNRDACLETIYHCFELLLGYLQGGEMRAAEYIAVRKKFEEAQKCCTLDSCRGCLAAANRFFSSETKLLQDAGIYKVNEQEMQIQEMDEEAVAALVGEPLSNVVRIKMLKALEDQPMSFAELGKLTGLRGGNLLFHLEKLSGCGMILQKGERKEYAITECGRELLQAAAVLMKKLNG